MIEDKKPIEEPKDLEEVKRNKQNEEEQYTSITVIDVCKSSYKEIVKQIKSIPLFCRFTLIISFIMIVLKLIDPALVSILILNPSLVISKLHIWTLITGVFIPRDIINYVVCGIIWVHRAKYLEESLSTTRYSINFIINILLISLLYFAIGIISPITRNITMSGMLSNSISEIILLCLSNPNVELSMIFFSIKAKYYHLILSCILVIIHFGCIFDILIGYIFSFLFFYVLKIRLSDSITEKIELAICNILQCFDCFIKLKVKDKAQIQVNQSYSVEDSKSIEVKENRSKNKTKSSKNNNINIEKLDNSSETRTQNKGVSTGNVNYINLNEIE